MQSFYYTFILHQLCQKKQNFDYHDLRECPIKSGIVKVFEFGIKVFDSGHIAKLICYIYIRNVLNYKALNPKALFLHKLAINRT